VSGKDRALSNSLNQVICKSPPSTLIAILSGGLAVTGMACGGPAGNAPATPSSTSTTSVAVPAVEAEPLRTAAGGRLLGTAVQASLLPDSVYASVVSRHFSVVTPENEMKWAQIERARGQASYAAADAIVGFARDRGQRVRGHTLIWHGSVPTWFDALSASEASQAIENHIRTTVGRYRGQIVAWDVVNEAVADGAPGLRDTVYLRRLGPGYIAAAFRLAHEADPDALLFYNDYGAEGVGRKANDVFALVSSLVAAGVPIDGVGLQMHLDAAARPATADIAANIRRLTSLGLAVDITEMDVRVARLGGTLSTRLEEQARIYHDVVAVCVAEPRCGAITFWGFTDRHSWIDAAFGADDPLLFDETYRTKPAYNGVIEALRGR
jgi:endo-1,4-beta-xylanase